MLISLLFSALSSTTAEIIGSPTIECNTDGIKVFMNMSSPFSGKIYLRDHSATPGCFVDYTEKPTSQLEPIFKFENCHPRRKRETAPVGMRMQTRMIIAHHPKVETYRDTAYDIDCFYRQQSEVVTAAQELRVISDIPPQEMRMEPAPPQCTYQVEMGNATETPGPVISTVFVGDTVTHVWSCEEGGSKNYHMYCFKVHSCMARGEDEAMTVVDQNGCITESDLLSPLYSSTAGRTTAVSRVFKFPKATGLYFDCQISFTLRIHEDSGICPVNQCVDQSRTLSRPKRSVGPVVEVESQELIILEDRLAFLSPSKNPKCDWINGSTLVVSTLFFVYFVLTFCVWWSSRQSEDSWSLEV